MHGGEDCDGEERVEDRFCLGGWKAARGSHGCVNSQRIPYHTFSLFKAGLLGAFRTRKARQLRLMLVFGLLGHHADFAVVGAGTPQKLNNKLIRLAPTSRPLRDPGD